MSSSSLPFFRHKSLTIVQAFSFRIDFFGLLFFFISDDVHERFSGKKDIGLYWRQFRVRKTILMQRSSEIELPLTIWYYHCVIDVANALKMSSSSFPFFGHKSLTIVQAFPFRIDFFGLRFFFIFRWCFWALSRKNEYWSILETIWSRENNFDAKVIRDWAAFNNLMLPLCYWRRECIKNVIKFISIFRTQKPYYSPGFFVQNRFFWTPVFLHFPMMFLRAFQERWILVYIGDNLE